MQGLLREVKESFSCTICLEIYSSPVLLRCGHRFCQECIVEYLGGKSKGCPLCKVPTNKRDLHTETGLGTLLGIVMKYSKLETPVKASTTFPMPKSFLQRRAPPSEIKADEKENTMDSRVSSVLDSRMSIPMLQREEDSRTLPGMTSLTKAAMQQTKEMRVGASALPPEQKADVDTFRIKFSLKGCRAGAATHLVTAAGMDPEKGKYAARTFKVMFAMVNKVPVIEYRWVRESVLAGKVLDPEPYRLRRDRISDGGFIHSETVVD